MAGRSDLETKLGTSQEKKIYVTYDVNETGDPRKPLIYRAAIEVPIQGTLTSWEIGEFRIRGVEEVYGVKLRYRPSDGGAEKEQIVDTSAYAQNVQIFVGTVPAEYRDAIKTVVA